MMGACWWVEGVEVRSEQDRSIIFRYRTQEEKGQKRNTKMV